MASTALAPPPTTTSLNDRVLFAASFLTLIAAGIGFSVRGAILKDWGQQYGFTQSELGSITGFALAFFGPAIILFSFLADVFGYGKIMLIAFVLHLLSAVVTLAAGPVFAMYGKEGAYWCLMVGMLLFSLGNGTCEAVINPLTATLFPNEKTHRLNNLHAGWPAGLILGALIVLGLTNVGESIRWEVKLGIFLVPVFLYGFLMFNRPFPRSEASTSGVSLGQSLLVLLSPILLFIFVLHALVGYVELGTDSWITNITERVLNNGNYALAAFIWTNLLMCVLRFTAGPIVHKINPIGLLLISAVLGCVGLALLGMSFTDSIWPWVGAVTIYGVGKTFYWPTLLGVISERFPKGGALALGISGGIGMMSAGFFGGPGIGYKQDFFAVQKITESNPAAYDRYVGRDETGTPKPDAFPVLSKLLPDKLPPVAGLDNAKLKVMDDYGPIRAEAQKKARGEKSDDKLQTTLQFDLSNLEKLKQNGKTVEPKLEEGLRAQQSWWETKGQPNYDADSKNLDEARVYGAKQALLYTAGVPAALAVGFLLLLLYFAATGGYKQVHI